MSVFIYLQFKVTARNVMLWSAYSYNILAAKTLPAACELHLHLFRDELLHHLIKSLQSYILFVL